MQLLVLGSLLIAYTGQTFFAYFLFLIALFAIFPRLSLRIEDALFLTVVVAFAVVKGALESDLFNVYQIFRFFFGFTLFLVFFRQADVRPSLHVPTVLVVLALATLIEALLVNTFVPITSMPHFPQHESIGASEGYYQRPYGFAYNPTATSTLIVCLMVLSLRSAGLSPRNRYMLDAIGAAAVIACGSGMGYFLLALYFIFFSSYAVGTKTAMVVGAALAYMYYFLIHSGAVIVDTEAGTVYKISPEYFHFLTSYKLELTSEIPDDLLQLLIGRDYGPEGNTPLLSDFGWLELFLTCGAVGLILYGWCILSNLRPLNRGPLLVLMIGALHYGGLFTLPGQILFAYCLTARATTPVMVRQRGSSVRTRILNLQQ